MEEIQKIKDHQLKNLTEKTFRLYTDLDLSEQEGGDLIKNFDKIKSEIEKIFMNEGLRGRRFGQPVLEVDLETPETLEEITFKYDGFIYYNGWRILAPKKKYKFKLFPITDWVKFEDCNAFLKKHNDIKSGIDGARFFFGEILKDLPQEVPIFVMSPSGEFNWMFFYDNKSRRILWASEFLLQEGAFLLSCTEL